MERIDETDEPLTRPKKKTRHNLPIFGMGEKIVQIPQIVNVSGDIMNNFRSIKMMQMKWSNYLKDTNYEAHSKRNR